MLFSNHKFRANGRNDKQCFIRSVNIGCTYYVFLPIYIKFGAGGINSDCVILFFVKIGAAKDML
jgi:hypothetical protein